LAVDSKNILQKRFCRTGFTSTLDVETGAYFVNKCEGNTVNSVEEEYIRSCIEYEKGLVEDGDSKYIKNIFCKALNGEEITVGFLGGSITQDSVTTKHEFGYAYRVYDWFCKAFPNSKIKYVNAGIGATNSEYAAARVKEHLLAYEPDFILMEHAVNDDCTEHYMETYEGVVRQILTQNLCQALLLTCNVYYNDGANAELMHRRIARHYDLPVVSMRPTIFAALLAGKFDNRLITADDLHPNDLGHELVAKVITTYLEKLLLQVKKEIIEDKASLQNQIGERKIPDPYTANRFEKSIKLDNRNSVMLDGKQLPDLMRGPEYNREENVKASKGVKRPSVHFPGLGVKINGQMPVIKSFEGFVADKTKQEIVRECFVHGYLGTQKGSYIQYDVTGSCIAVMYKRTIKLPAPIAKCVIDGDEEKATILDANFDETWGDKLVLTDVYLSMEKTKHTVRIEIIETHPDDIGEFYLAGLIVS